MIRFLGVRLAASAFSLLLISVLAFSIVHAVPGSAATAIVGTGDPAAIAETEARLGLDRPVVEQYVDWLGNAVRGDFGEALVTNRGSEVSTLLRERIPPSLAISLAGLIISVCIGIPAGVAAGLRPGGRLDRAITLLGSLWIAVPNFLIAMLAVRWLGAELGWFPVIGLPSITEDPLGWAHALVLPAVTLSMAAAAVLARQTRGALIDVLQQDYIRTALANGLPRARIIRRHALKNTMVPVLTLIGFQAATLLGGTVVAEQVFAIQGLGQLGVTAVLEHDFPVVQGFVMMTAVLVVLVNLLIDVGYGWANPKVRTQ